MRNFSRFLASLALLCGAQAAAQDAPMTEGEAPRPQLALMGTIPIYWGEAAGLGEILRGEAEPHWARGLIEQHAEPVPLDYLSTEALAPFDMLLMAQPRGLTGEENVALDAWVRGGGHLLLFADPRMTGESRFGIGDRRRPQDTILLSPILAHWGLELTFDESRSEALVDVIYEGYPLPANMWGEFRAIGEAQSCNLKARRIVADCTIGAGRALLVADAAVLDLAGPHDGAQQAFARLLAGIFPDFGDGAGYDEEIAQETGDSVGNGRGSYCERYPTGAECAGEGVEKEQ